MRRRIFKTIELSDGADLWSNVYDYLMIIVIVASLIPLAFKDNNATLTIIDRIAVAIFIIDYMLRLLTADYKLGKRFVVSVFLYPFTPLAIIDLVSILPSLTILNSGFKLFRLLRMLRAFRVFRVFKALRYSKSMNIIVSVLKKQKAALRLLAH